MKTKIALIFSNIFLLSLLLVSWNGKEKIDNSKTNSNLSTYRLNLISEADASLLANNYNESVNKINRNNNFRTLNLSEWKDDSRSVWFDYNELQGYLEYIKNQFSANQDPYKGKLGVRIYFGRYPNELTQNASPGLRTQVDIYKNKHCLFFVPTTNQKGSSENYDAIIKKDTPEKGGFYISNILSIGSEKNHGNLVPPRSYEGSNFYNLRGESISH